jgi:hypothetical protein
LEAVGGGGGFSTVTVVSEEAFRPRSSVHFAVTVIGPADAPAVSSVAVLPVPETLPPLAVYSVFTCALSGLVQEQVIVEGVPACTVVGFAEQEIVGGCFGFSFTVKFAVQLASA